ncbi:MAG: hypothetical protein IKC59_04245 [Clostridia bacterium]|nr:hypothetical protein [Clostridia bacterium]
MMKFSDYLQAPGVRPLSVGIGLLIGSGTALFTDWMMGIFVGAIAVLILSFLIPTVVYVQDIPYLKIKKSLPRPFVFDERVRFTVHGGNAVTGYFVLTEERMVFLTVERGMHRLELSRTDVRRILTDPQNYCINIYLDDQKFVRVQTPVSEEMLRVLNEKGWG